MFLDCLGLNSFGSLIVRGQLRLASKLLLPSDPTMGLLVAISALILCGGGGWQGDVACHAATSIVAFAAPHQQPSQKPNLCTEISALCSYVSQAWLQVNRKGNRGHVRVNRS